MSEDDIAEHDPLQCTCFDCLHDAGYGLQQAVDILLQQHDDEREHAGDALPGHSRTFQDFEAVWTIHPGAQYRMVYLGYVASFDSAANTYDITIPENNTVFRRVPAAFVWKIHPSKLPGEDDD